MEIDEINFIASSLRLKMHFFLQKGMQVVKSVLNL